MCGIAGIIRSDATIDLEQSGKAMAAALSHRGPDDSQVLVEDSMALVHTRLAIQDLSANGRQPMASISGRYIIVFNGEIYNFLKLKESLQQLGHGFNGGSDTEVLLAAIEQYGIEKALTLLEGMFAFVLIDRKEKELHLCRDRLGEKPLYYGWSGNSFVWASELKALKALPHWSANMNRDIVPAYLKYGYVPTPWTLYRDFYKLESGTLLTLSLDNLWEISAFSPLSNSEDYAFKPKKYWDLHKVIGDGLSHQEQMRDQFDYQQSVERLDELLVEVVTDQMVSDVPIGAFLSGGIDSSLVSSIMQSISNKPINTFTIGFNEKDYNEAEFAEKIARHIGSHHHQLYISSEDCLQQVQNLPTMFDEPFADSSALPAFFVSAMAKKEVTVCLSGDAGDELFCGYNRYVKTDQIWRKVNRLPQSLRKIISSLMLRFPPALYEKVYYFCMSLLSSKSKNTRIGLKVQKLAALLRMDSVGDIYEMLISYCQPNDNIWLNRSQQYTLFDSYSITELNKDNRFIEQAMAIDTLTYLPDDNLTKVDRTSMASSLETRLPLLNHRVVEFAWQLPLVAKTYQGSTKRILRDVLYKRVPRELIERPKMGFSVPIANWLKGPLKEWASSLLTDDRYFDHQSFNLQAVARLWEQHLNGAKDNSAALWSILMYQAWYQNNA